MVLVTSNKRRRLLCLNYIKQVVPAELASAREDLKVLLAELPPGFRLLVDLSQVEFMDQECAVEIGRSMDQIRVAGVGLIVRVIPDASKDIGMSILSVFHYPHELTVLTCATLAQALERLA